MTFQRTLLTLTAIALGLGAATQVQAAIIFTLPTASATGSITVTNDIAFTVTTAGTAKLVVFDEWVTSDGSPAVVSFISPALSYSLNSAAPTTVEWISLVDNQGFTHGNLSPNDGYFFFGDVTMASGDVFTLKAATYTIAAMNLPAGFNPQAAQTFTGNAFLADGNGFRKSALTPVNGAVPEPGTAALGALAGLTLLRRRRR